MSETNTAPAIPTITLSKADHSVNLIPWTFIRGENKDHTFLAPKVEASESDILKHIRFLGVQVASGILQKYYKAAGQSAHLDALAEDGSFDSEKFKALFMEEISNVSLKKAELQNQKDELTTELLGLVRKMSTAPAHDHVAIQQRMSELSGQIQVTSEAIAKKARKPKQEVAEEPAVVA